MSFQVYQDLGSTDETEVLDSSYIDDLVFIG